MEGIKDGKALAEVVEALGRDVVAKHLKCSSMTVWRALRDGKTITVYKDKKGWRAVESKAFPDVRYVR